MGLFAYQHENLKLVSNMLLRGALQLFLIKLKRPKRVTFRILLFQKTKSISPPKVSEKKSRSRTNIRGRRTSSTSPQSSSPSPPPRGPPKKHPLDDNDVWKEVFGSSSAGAAKEKKTGSFCSKCEKSGHQVRHHFLNVQFLVKTWGLQ